MNPFDLAPLVGFPAATSPDDRPGLLRGWQYE
jgi:hypothetical protein